MNELLTAAEVAARYGLKLKTIYRRCDERRMVPPPVMVRPFRFNAQQVQQVIDGTYVHPKPAQVGTPRRFFAKAGGRS